MEKYKKYYGLIVFIVTLAVLFYVAYKITTPALQTLKERDITIEQKTQELEKKQNELNIVKKKIKAIKDSISGSSKKIYSPIESDLGNDSLFFTLYNDIIEMIHANSVKIKSIDYIYNPESDAFVQFGKDVYFVCDIKMELISNYVNLGKLIEDIYAYPYYIKFNEVHVVPYPKDKKTLITNMSLRLYAHTSPDEENIPNE